MTPLPPQALDATSLERYDRQARFSGIGREGQSKICAGRVLICGCGALGTVVANTLARAGVGFLRIVDRDLVELSNLQRQVLFTEEDAREHLPKAIAAQRHLNTVNRNVEVEAHICHLDPTNVEELTREIDIIVDGTDNFETRFLLNDAAHCYGIPWIYGGCLAAEGQSMTILPGKTPCFRCLLTEPPPVGSTPTCDTAGVLGPIVNIVASWQSMEVLKWLSGKVAELNRRLAVFDVWNNLMHFVELSRLDEHRCATCRSGEFPWLRGERTSQTAVLCGRNAVQLTFADQQVWPLAILAEKLAELGSVQQNAFFVRAKIDAYELILFADGRAVIGGTSDPNQARTVYARYVGH